MLSDNKVIAELKVTWRPGDYQWFDNLRGTRLDIGCYDSYDRCYSNGLGWGPLSKQGWAVWGNLIS